MNHPGSPWLKEPEGIGLWEVLGCIILSKTSTSVISMTVVTMWGVQHYSHCTVTAADMQKWNPGTNTGVHEWELAWKHTYLTPPNRAFSGAVEEQTGEMTARHCQEQTAGVKTPQDSFFPALEGNTRQRPWVSTGRLGLRSVRRHNAAHSRPSPRGLELALRSLLLTVWPLFLLCSVAHLSAVQGHPVEFSPGRSFWVKKKNGWKKRTIFDTASWVLLLQSYYEREVPRTFWEKSNLDQLHGR